MTALFRGSLRTGTLMASLLLLVLTAPTLASEDDVKVPFLFSEDEKLAQTDLLEAVPRSSALPADQFLNAPMTRLDYMLMMMEARLNEDSRRTHILDLVAAAFEPERMKGTKFPAAITGYARYARAIGRVFVEYTVEHLGRPRRPMRAMCDDLLSELDFVAPREQIGFLYHNTVLGVLAQKDFAEYTPTLETLARSVVHRVRLQSKIEDQRVVHGLTCQRSGKGAPVLYHRYSFKLH